MVHRRTVEPDRGHVLSGPVLSDDAAGFLTALTGAAPQRPDMWNDALTHGSMGETRDYQRLEFLGDRVLGLVIADWLYERSEGAEGKLSQRLNALVARETCADVARALGVQPYMRLGKQARDDGGADSDNILGDVMEALIGALFLERGFEAARAFVRKAWARPMEGGTGQRKHPKAALQEWAAGNRRKPPVYAIVSREGPDHAATFTVSVSVKGVGEAEARGSSKQEAETNAARDFMKKFA
ncbi:ribonuclease III [Novosphingobium cyanobacteriorum]|uniref:Ribonuclease 3 n=1 Tax=Novosphingobium cyanobacteriorum TaxID=3024215 RepID=A0ABT6CLK3_9SPHN|nr:ribonuclease III [Novosphingobium cyanobacteriorum]MDF8333945.1 ribonuclease III [Novosphingobium cyanobacteriorum]